jgi:hypothetical protein
MLDMTRKLWREGVTQAGWRLAFLVTLLLSGSAVVGWWNEPPKPLPGVALGSPLLLHLQRATVVFWFGLLLVTVLLRALSGQLPIEFSSTGARYAEVNRDIERTQRETRAALEDVQGELASLQEALDQVLRTMAR